jgi:hypothetical protein
MPSAASSTRAALAGPVMEALPSGPYTYLRVADRDGEHWAVVMGAHAFAVGDPVDLRVMGERRDFESARLQRRFARLFFAAPAPPATRSPSREHDVAEPHVAPAG